MFAAVRFCQNLLTVMTVAPGRRSGMQLAMGERADAMCGVECYSNAGVVDQVQVQLAGDRGRMHRTNGSSSLLEKVDSLLCCPPSPQPASLEVLKGGFFVERVVPVFFPADQSSLVHLGEASGKQAACIKD